MADYFGNFKTLDNKLAETLAKHNMVHSFRPDKYPITLTISQDKSIDAQMELYSNADGSVSSADAILRFIFTLGDTEIQTNSRFVISDTLMTKIKNQAKKMRDAYLFGFFAAYKMSQPVADDNDDEDEENDNGVFDGFYDDEETKKDGAGE